MKKLLLLLLTCLLTTAAWADTWTSAPTTADKWKEVLSSYSQSSAPASWTATSNGLELAWTFTYDWATNSQYFVAGKNGLTFGASSKGIKSLTLTCDPGQNIVISKVTIKGLKTGDGSGTASVKLVILLLTIPYPLPTQIQTLFLTALLPVKLKFQFQVLLSANKLYSPVLKLNTQSQLVRLNRLNRPLPPNLAPMRPVSNSQLIVLLPTLHLL